MFRSKSLAAWAVAVSLALLAVGGSPAWARGATDEHAPAWTGGSIPLSALPVQGQDVWRQIHLGGPFREEKDGTVFGNRERQLPLHKRGYYREYTVATPGLDHRGAKRIVCGGFQPRTPEACYYTADHYASFQKIAQ